MKKLILAFLIVWALFTSCSKYIVKTIVYDVSKDSVIYYGANGAIPKKEIVIEGSKITVIAKNPNPLSKEISVTQDASQLFYMTNQSKTSIAFFNTDITSIQQSQGTMSSNANISDNNKKTISNKTEIINDNIKKFKDFYNALVDLNYLLESFKTTDSIGMKCICSSLEKVNSKVTDNFFDHEDPTLSNDCSKLSAICGEVALADKMVDQAEKYKDFFSKQPTILSSLQEEIKKEKISDKDYIQVMEIISSLNKDLSAISNAISDKYMNSIIDISNKYRLLYDLKFTERMGTFIPEETDIFKLNVTINDKVQNKTITRPISLQVCKAIKIDFSAGVFATTLLDESYRISKNQTDTSYSYSKYKPNKIGYGTMGVINFHPTIPGCRQFSVGGSIGTGLMFNNSTKFVLAPTVSCFFGQYQRVVVHIGAAIGLVDRISSIYKENESYKNADYVPEIKQEVHWNWLVGLSWNLSRN